MPSPADARLADTLLKHGLVAQRDIEEALSAKSILDALIDKKKLEADAALSIDELLKGKGGMMTQADLAFCGACAERRFAGPAELQAALVAQRRLAQQIKLRRPLGEILWSMKKIDEMKLAEANKMVRVRIPDVDPALVDPLILTPDEDARVSRGIDGGKLVSKEHLEACLRAAQALMRLGMERKMGEILVLLGAIRRVDIAALEAPAAKPRKIQAVPEVRPARDPREPRAPREPREPRAGKPAGSRVPAIVAVLVALGIVGGAAGVYVKQQRDAQNAGAGSGTGESSEGPVATANQPPVTPGDDVAAVEERLPEDAADKMRADAERAVSNRQVFRAVDLYGVLARRGDPAHPEYPEVLRRHERTAEIARALDALIAGINARRDNHLMFNFDAFGAKLLESADRSEIVVRMNEQAPQSKILWGKVSVTEVLQLFDLTGAADQQPLGAAAYSLQFADGRGAANLVADMPEAQRKRLLGWYPGAKLGGHEEIADSGTGSKPETVWDEMSKGKGGSGEKGTPGDKAGAGEKGTPGGADPDPERAAREARAKAATEAAAQARGLAAQGRSAEALEGLARALQAARGTGHEAALQAAWDEIAARFVRVLDAFDGADSAARWQAIGGRVEWNGLKDYVRAGAGSLLWDTGEGDVSALIFAGAPGDWTSFAVLSLWVYAEKKGTDFEVRLTAGPQDGLGHQQTVDWTGWKRLRLPLDKFRRVGKPDLAKVETFGFFHFKGAASGKLYVDELRLEAATLPAVLGGEAPEGPPGGTGGGNGGGGNGGGEPGRKTPTPEVPLTAEEIAAQKKWPRPTARHYVNLDHGVAIVPPQGWNTIPAPKEVNQEFRREESIKSLVRFDARNPDPMNFGIGCELSVMPGAASLDQAVETLLNQMREQVKPEGRIPWRVGPWKGTFFQLPGRFFHNVVVLHEGRKAAAMVFTSGEKYGRKKADMFRQLAATFLFVSEANLRILRNKKAGQTDLPTGWKVHMTPHYEVQYNCDDDFAKQVGKHLEAILKEYMRRWPMEATLDDQTGKLSDGVIRRFTVKVFKTNEEFNSYASANGVGGAAAYFSPMQDELVAYKTTDQGKDKTFHILYHEASHQYLHLYMGREVDLPIWLNEGVAEFFYGGEFKPDGSFLIEENKDRISDIKEAIRTGAYVPLKDIFQYTQAQYYSNAGVCYAEGWAIAYFLWRTKDEKYAGRLDKYYDVLKSSGDKNEAHQAAFGDLDIMVFEEDWKKFILTM